MIISISGLHGTGKSTIAKRIAEALSYEYYSTGNAFREKARELNMSLEEFTRHVEKHPEIDNELDEKIIKIAKKGDIVVDSQLSGFLLKSIADLRIILTCPLETRVKRMAERDGTLYDEKMEETLMRENSEAERFNELYNIDLNDVNQIKEAYDVIIATEGLSIEQVFNNVMHVINSKNHIAS
jgi:cytidylate kinase